MLRITTALALALTLTSCASTKSNVSQRYSANSDSKMSVTINSASNLSIPEEQYQLLESHIREGLTQKDLLSPSSDAAAHDVVIDIQAFRLRNDAARLTVGIMAGCDKIRSHIVVTERSTQKEIGRSDVSIKECAAWGVANQVIRKYGDGVVEYLSDN